MSDVRVIPSRAFAARVIPDVAGTETAAALAERQQRARTTGWGALCVADPLAGVCTERGLVRGHQYQIAGDASLSLMYALVARATAEGSWLAMVNVSRAGLAAAKENGVAMHRVLGVSIPSHASSAVWASTVGALVDGVDLVVVSDVRCSANDARRLAARVRAAGSVLLVLGDCGACVPDGKFGASTVRWNFDAHAHSRVVRIRHATRRVHAVRECSVLLPGPSGCIESMSESLHGHGVSVCDANSEWAQ